MLVGSSINKGNGISSSIRSIVFSTFSLRIVLYSLITVNYGISGGIAGAVVSFYHETELSTIDSRENVPEKGPASTSKELQTTGLVLIFFVFQVHMSI